MSTEAEFRATIAALRARPPLTKAAKPAKANAMKPNGQAAAAYRTAVQGAFEKIHAAMMKQGETIIRLEQRIAALEAIRRS